MKLEEMTVKLTTEIQTVDRRQGERRHNHYFKDVSHYDTVDVYRILTIFSVTDPCIQHAIKKLLVAGGRGAGKDISRDIKEAIDSLERWQEMREEDSPEPMEVRTNLVFPPIDPDFVPVQTC